MIYSCMKYSWIFYIRCFGCDTVEELCDSPHSKALDVTLVGKKNPNQTKQYHQWTIFSTCPYHFLLCEDKFEEDSK